VDVGRRAHRGRREPQAQPGLRPGRGLRLRPRRRRLVRDGQAQGERRRGGRLLRRRARPRRAAAPRRGARRRRPGAGVRRRLRVRARRRRVEPGGQADRPRRPGERRPWDRARAGGRHGAARELRRRRRGARGGLAVRVQARLRRLERRPGALRVRRAAGRRLGERRRPGRRRGRVRRAARRPEGGRGLRLPPRGRALPRGGEARRRAGRCAPRLRRRRLGRPRARGRARVLRGPPLRGRGAARAAHRRRLSLRMPGLALARGGGRPGPLARRRAGFGGDLYWVAGTAHGTVPGFAFGGLAVPLNPDGYFLFTVAHPGLPPSSPASARWMPADARWRASACRRAMRPPWRGRPCTTQRWSSTPRR
jgi:hypothetical protein